MAPKVGLEPTTDRLTADCSTIELLWIPLSQMGRVIYKRIPVASTGFSPANRVACKGLRAAGLLPGCFASRSYCAQGGLSNDGLVRPASPSGRGKADGFQWAVSCELRRTGSAFVFRQGQPGRRDDSEINRAILYHSEREF